MNVVFSLELSIVLTLLAAAMWGSWMQIIKHLKGYPISGVTFWLYTFSFVLVWGVTFAVSPLLMEESIPALTAQHSGVILNILLGGGMMSLGMYISLRIIGDVGLLLSTTVSGGVGTLLGIATSIMNEGMPKGRNVGLLLALITAVFIAAGFLSSYCSHLKSKDKGTDKKQGVVTGKIILLMLLSIVLVNGWSMGTSAGTASGLPPVLTCAFMATGSFISVALVCAVEFTVKKRWRQVLCIGSSKKPLILCAVSAVCHYGGNLISIYSMPAISATISFLMGKSSSLWTIFWGIFYGEFSGVSKRTRRVLFASIALYLIGIALLALYKYT